VPVGINLSGGLDSSVLLGAVQLVQGRESDIKAFTYITGETQYDELPWVELMLERTQHPAAICRVSPSEVPALAESLQAHEDEPFGGLPTIAYAKLFDLARHTGTIVLLDGQGMDEQWAGYDYYAAAADAPVRLVQGTSESPVRPECLIDDFRALATPLCAAEPFSDRLRNAQYRDARYTKIPKALRFNDRASMRASTELREPFLDHRLFELAVRQPAARKIRGSTHKWLLRELGRRWLPTPLVEAPKRPVSTPQREWLRGPLQPWAEECIADGLDAVGGTWLHRDRVRRVWEAYKLGHHDNSFFVWQWMTVGLMTRLNMAVVRDPAGLRPLSSSIPHRNDSSRLNVG
jgi:asparagine synthase (glutamine-hydrolysing)